MQILLLLNIPHLGLPPQPLLFDSRVFEDTEDSLKVETVTGIPGLCTVILERSLEQHLRLITDCERIPSRLQHQLCYCDTD